MANTTKYQKTPKSKAELIAEARIRQQHKKEAEATQTPEQKQGIPVLSDIWNFIGNVPVVGKWYSTLADFSTEAFQGAVSTIEGIVDMAASVVGKFGDENFKKKVQDFIKTDFTGTYITPLVKDTIPAEQSLITALPEEPQRIVRGVGQGIGQMAPALLTGGIGSAAGLGAGAVQAIGTGTFIAGAGGRGVQEAYQEGASYDEGLAYGILSGALEGAIERLTGGVGTKVFGKGLINKVVGKAAKSGLFKLAMNAAGEGFEEVLSEVLNPYLQRLTYDKDAPTATKEEILESAIIGALTSIALGSTAQDVDIKAIQNAQQEISRAWAENRAPDLNQATQELQKLDAKTRKAILETTNLSRYIDENGNIKQFQQTEAYSPNLDESKLAYKPTTQALTAEQQEAKKLFAQLTKGNKGLVFAEMPEGVKGAYKDGVVYVNIKANAAQEIIKHELAHSVEGTKAYNKFAKHVLQTLIDNPELAKNIKGETLEQSITKTSELYQKVLEGKDLTEQQREILTEIVAQYSEKLLTDKTQIERLVNQDRSIAQRILDWIRDKLAVLKGKTKLERETIEFLRKAERLYVEALEMPVVAKQKKYSLTDLPDIDSEGRKLTKEQQEFFKDSKVRDEQGRLLVVYHGTGAEFTVFDRKKARSYSAVSYDLPAFYFTSDKRQAKDYGSRVVEAYINIKNPLIAEDQLPTIRAGETPNDLYNRLVKEGYDGIIIPGESLKDNEYIVFHPNQIKLTTNLNPTTNEDIRYSLDKKYTQDDTIHLKPTKLDKLQQKRYTKKEAETIVKNILNEISLENYTAKLKGETKKEAVKVLWNALNTKTVGNRAKPALDIAEYILNNAVAVDITANDAVLEAASVQDTLRRYLRSLDLTNLQGEIKARYGSVKRMNLLWGKKGGIAVDALPRILAQEGIHIEAKTPADILFEVDELYANSQKRIKDAAEKRLAEVFGQKELKGIKSQIARDILRSYDEYGTETAFTKQLNKYAEKISTLKEQLKETRALYEAENKLKNTIDRVAGLEKFAGASQELTELVGGLVKSLSKIKTPWGNISKNVREAMRGYKKFYAELADVSESDLQTDYVYKMISDIADGEGRLTLDEMRNLNVVLKNFIHNANEYRKIFLEGKKQDALEIATRTIEELRKTKKVATTGLKGLWNKLRHWLESPSARFERLGMYGLAGDTVMKALWDSFVEAEQMQAAFLRDTYLMFYDFFEQNKDYLKKLYKSKVGFAGDKISKGQAMYLYLLSLREQIIAHIYNLQMGKKPSDSDKGIIRVTNDKYDDPYKAFLYGRDITYTRADIKALEKHFDATDKEFIKLARKFFNEHAKEAKRQTDLKIYGLSNVSETGDYISAHTSKDTLYTKIGERDLFTELFNVYNPGFNKDVKPNAKNKLVVGNIYDVINRHAQQMALYAGYGAPVRTFNRIINTEVGGTTVKQMLMEVDPDFLNYVNKLLKDAQGIRQHREGFDKFLGQIRGMGARAALGLNPKVVTTQFVSLFASKGVGIEYKNILKGAKKAMKATKADYDLMYKYVPMAWVRANSGFNAEIGFIKEGQGIIGKTNKWLDKTTALIEKVDSWVVFAVWNAALEQTKSQYTPFSEEHYKAAAKLTHEAVVKTQANYIPLYRPEILRSQSSFVQLTTMFMSEPLQQFSQAVEAIDKIIVANYIIKNSKDANIIANAERIKNQALTQARNTFTMLTVNSILLVAITQAFKYLLGKQDEEDPLGDIGNDFLGIVTGMFPFVRDIHSYLEGYDITNMYQTGLTTIANAFKDAASLLGGDTENTARNMRRTLIGVSQIFGIPLRNLETYAKGIIGLFSPSAKYKYEDLFYRQSYAKDLSRAVEKGDDKLADTIIDLMLNDKGIGKTDEKARAEILKLYAAGESVLPSGVPKTVTINGEERKLTEAERRQITNIYSQADITKLVNMPEYSKLSSGQKARAIKIVYDIYKDKAFSSVLGLDISKRALFAYAIDASIIAYVLAVVGDMAGDKKLKMQQLINKLDISAAQKYMLMGLLGYKNKNGAGQVKAYINRLDLSREEKKRLYEYSGY